MDCQGDTRSHMDTRVKSTQCTVVEPTPSVKQLMHCTPVTSLLVLGAWCPERQPTFTCDTTPQG